MNAMKINKFCFSFSQNVEPSKVSTYRRESRFDSITYFDDDYQRFDVKVDE